MEKLVSALLIVVGVIHLLPVMGVLGAGRLATLYGIDVDEPNLEILMRHRAVLFGVLGAFLVYAAFVPALQWVAIAAGLVSVASFIGLAWAVGQYNAELGRVVLVDLVAIVALVVAAAVRLLAAAPGS